MAKKNGYSKLTGKMNKIYTVFVILILITGACKKTEKTPNILLVTIDTLRFDHMSCYGYSRNTTPFIDQLAKRGVKFNRVITPLPATDASHASILTGLHPLTHNVITNATVLSDKVQTLSEVLKSNGYYTIGTIAVQHMSSKYNFSQGFDSFSDSWDVTDKLNTPHARIAQSVNKSLGQQLDVYLHGPDREKPLFIWVHYFDPHKPYMRWDHVKFKNPVPQDYQTKFPDNSKFVDAYDNEIRYVDAAVEELLNYLKGAGLSQNLITCITADHGEQFGEHGILNDHADFYSEITFVPLIFTGPGIHGQSDVSQFVSTMDISVTLLSLVGLKFNSPVEGIDIKNQVHSSKPANKDREFLVIGYPSYTKSMQYIRHPFSYIQNLDAGQKCIYYTRNNNNAIFRNFLERKLIKINENKSRHDSQEDVKPETTSIELPDVSGTGEYFSVCHVMLHNGQAAEVEILGEPRLLYGRLSLPEGTNSFTVFIPVTFLDELTLLINGKEKKVPQLSCYHALLSKKEFLALPGSVIRGLQSLESEVFMKLRSLRKNSPVDERYNLEYDFTMNNTLINNQKNLVDPGVLQQRMLNYFLKYRNMRTEILGGTKKGKKYSTDEINKLKSLGYL